MPRENSFSDSEGRSLTPELEDDAMLGVSPVYEHPTTMPFSNDASRANNSSVTSHKAAVAQATSLRSRLTQRTQRTQRTTVMPDRPSMTPKERFRSSVRKLIHMRRGATGMTMNRGAGAEPGIDPRRQSAILTYGHIKENCVIEVVDYSSVRSSAGKMTNREFVDFLQSPAACEREPWVKVRWINIGGISWDVISALAIKYELHPLALEDVLHVRDTRSKADYFTRHLFIRALCHKLGHAEAKSSQPDPSLYNASDNLVHHERSDSPVPFVDSESQGLESLNYEEPGGYHKRVGTAISRQSTLRFLTTKKDKEPDVEQSSSLTSRPKSFIERITRQREDNAAALEKRRQQELVIKELKKDERIPVDVRHMFIFLFRDGTVISIHPNADLTFTSPIAARLRQRDTLLRNTADPSMLVQSLLDLIVDRAMEVIDAYQSKINKFEKAILLKTKVKTVRNLHILAGDLKMHKRTLEPLKTLIYGMRRYDVDRCAALVDPSHATDPNSRVVGFLTHKTKIYLADVHDHMEYILATLDMFSSVTEHLMDYTFNMASYEMNEVMRRLTLATIVFLPLTLLTGYFGMNFDPMWSVQQNSDLLFWEIAIPVMCIIVPLFMGPDIRRLYRYTEKKMITKQALQRYKDD